MSYILDALRKADQQRSIGDVPDLDAPHWSRQRAGNLRNWIWVAIGLLLVNAVFLAVLFNPGDHDDAGTAESGNPSSPVRSLPGEVAQDMPQVTIAKPRQADSRPLKPLPRPEHRVITKPRQPLPSVERQLPEPAAADAGTGSGLQAEIIPESSRSPVARVAEPVQDSDPAIPEWNELPLEFRSGFNPPRLDVHVYDEDPSRRFILVGLHRFAEGDTLDSGAKLEKILPGSIQLYYEGTRFRYDR